MVSSVLVWLLCGHKSKLNSPIVFEAFVNSHTVLLPLLLLLLPVCVQALGIDNIMCFDWLAPPPAEAVVRGLELLHALGALDSDAR